MTIAVDLGRKATKQTKQIAYIHQDGHPFSYSMDIRFSNIPFIKRLQEFKRLIIGQIITRTETVESSSVAMVKLRHNIDYPTKNCVQLTSCNG